MWVAVALRLPTLQRRQAELMSRQQASEELAARQGSHLAESTAQLAERLAAIEAVLARVDLAQLAERLAVAEAQLARIDVAAQENLAISLPVALRRTARDIAQLRAQIGQAPCPVLDGSARENA